jgi:hypothetical protein
MLRVDELIGRHLALRRVTGLLRDDPRVTESLGRRAGMLVRGIGGVGKSALAGRLGVQADPQLARIGDLLLRQRLPDPIRLQQLQGLLANHRVLLVLDNFEDNLTLGGQAFLDETAGLGLDPERLGGDLDQALRDALRLGAEDVLLDQLIELVGARPEDLAALPPGRGLRPDRGHPRPRLRPGRRPRADAAAACSRRRQCPPADRHLPAHPRTRRPGLGPPLDRPGAAPARRFLEAATFDRAVEMARPILDFMGNYGQLVDVAGFAAGVLEALPADHPAYYAIVAGRQTC